MFEDRTDAGVRLAKALEKYKDTGAVVLGIPRGGVQVAYHVARYLNAEMSMIVTRKLPYPDEPEAGFGATAEDGSTFIVEGARRWLGRGVIDRIIEEQKKEVKRRIAALRGGRDLPEITGRTVILVDDGIAVGSTVRASIMLCRNRNVGKLVVAVPVSGADTAAEIARTVDEIVVLETPLYFRAVAQVYKSWYDLSDRQVLEVMAQ